MSSEESEWERRVDADIADLDKANRSARRRNLAIVALAVLALLFGLVCFFLAINNDRLAEDNARLAKANQQYGQEQAQEKKEIAKEARQALCGTKDTEIFDKDLCEKLAVAAQEPTVAPDVPPVDDGPSQAELVAAFRAYCAEGNCRGADGRSPTADDIAAAFGRFCADGRCTGPAGQNGQDGKPGENGKDAVALAPQYELVLAAVSDVCSSGACNGPAGQDGANATQEMVNTAVQTYCANDACRGPAGPPGADSSVPGPQGVQGEPGRGIQSAMCGDDGRWTITYTDGTTADGGVCRETITPPVGGPPL